MAAFPNRAARNKWDREYRKKHKFLTGVRIDLETYEEIKRIAEKQGDSFTHTVACLIDWGLEVVNKEGRDESNPRQKR